MFRKTFYFMALKITDVTISDKFAEKLYNKHLILLLFCDNL